MAITAYGSIYAESDAGTATVADTPIKSAVSTIEGPCHYFTMIDANKLQFNHDNESTCAVNATFSCSANEATNSKVHLYKNGSLIAGATIERKISNGTDVGAAAISTTVRMAADDYLELWVETNDGATLTIDELQMQAFVI